eukprot:6192015-Pleurochrysis_carterae.AAC.2
MHVRYGRSRLTEPSGGGRAINIHNPPVLAAIVGYSERRYLAHGKVCASRVRADSRRCAHVPRSCRRGRVRRSRMRGRGDAQVQTAETIDCRLEASSYTNQSSPFFLAIAFENCRANKKS